MKTSARELIQPLLRHGPQSSPPDSLGERIARHQLQNQQPSARPFFDT